MSVSESKNGPSSQRVHREARDVEWGDPAESALIAVRLEDGACPSFCTFSMTCFGEEAVLREYCRQEDLDVIAWIKRRNSARYKTEAEIRAAQEDGSWEPEESHMGEYLERSLKGEQLTWADMGATKLVIDVQPKVLGRARVAEEGFETVHLNIWDCPYTFTAERVETEVVWLEYIPATCICRDLPFNEDPSSARYKNAMANSKLSTDPIALAYARAIRVRMEEPNPFYGEDAMFVVEGERAHDKVKAFSTRLFLIDKYFESYDELKADMESFSPEQVNYKPIFDAQLGDG